MTDPITSSAGATAGRAGIASVLLASTCCVVPVALAVTGLGGLGLGAFFGSYHWYFLAGGVTALALGWGLYLRERRDCQRRQCQVTGGRRTLLTLTAATVLVAGLGALNAYTWTATPVAGDPRPNGAELSEVILPVDGMTCYTCGLAVEGSLRDVDGVGEAVASVPDKSVRVTFDAHKVDIQDLVGAVNRTGFRASAPRTGAS